MPFKTQLFICKNPRDLTVPSMSETISHCASALQKNAVIFETYDTGACLFNPYGIVHLYQSDGKWKPTLGTKSQMEKGSWWGVQITSLKDPYITHLKTYEFDEGGQLLGDAICTKKDLQEWYDDTEVQEYLGAG
jgi:hypothetical protein